MPESYTSTDACDDLRAMWHSLGSHFKSVAENSGDFIENPKDGLTTIQYARMAEYCLWQATGESSCAEYGDLERMSFIGD